MSTSKYKIVFIGDAGVGKTSICNRLVHDNFQSQDATIGASFLTHNIDGMDIQIWDTAGQERYRSLIPMYFRGADMCVLVYDISNKASFKDLSFWIKMLFDHCNEPHFIIIGNKLDSNREVTIEEAEHFANGVSAHYFEVSAKSGKNVFDTFLKIAEQMKKIPKSPKNKSKNIIKIGKPKPDYYTYCCFYS